LATIFTSLKCQYEKTKKESLLQTTRLFQFDGGVENSSGQIVDEDISFKKAAEGPLCENKPILQTVDEEISFK
jgi:hypothetical protein